MGGFLDQRRGRVNFSSLATVPQPVHRLLLQYEHRENVLTWVNWTEEDCQAALTQGSNHYMKEHDHSLLREFDYMVGKVQWVKLSYSFAWNLLGLRLSTLGVNKERDWQLRWLGDNSLSKINFSTLPIADISSMQCVKSLDRLLR